jgi:antibiotic biosynthesis monooxygenase (ABM) superfamily enzyme
MIARIWHGWTTPANADAYEALLRTQILPRIRQAAGCQGIRLFRRGRGDEMEFVTLLLFDSLDAVKAWAGDHYETAVVPPEARKLLKRFRERSRHYDVALQL